MNKLKHKLRHVKTAKYSVLNNLWIAQKLVSPQI